MISVAQIRAARGLLKWTQAMLAHRAAISTVTLNMIENEAVQPRDATLAAIQVALEQSGVQFLIEDGIGVGVRFCGNRQQVDIGRPSARPAKRGSPLPNSKPATF
jgi:DNA-binding XRE family transcriptional regulator